MQLCKLGKGALLLTKGCQNGDKTGDHQNTLPKVKLEKQPIKISIKTVFEEIKSLQLLEDL